MARWTDVESVTGSISDVWDDNCGVSCPNLASLPLVSDHTDLEEGSDLSLDFTKLQKIGDGGHHVVPVAVQDVDTGEVLIVAYANAEALEATLDRREAVFYSTSRNEIWHKGATSGLVQKVQEIRIDDDQDAAWLLVDVQGGASCHVGYRSCFYRSVPVGAAQDAPVTLNYEETEKVFDPVEVYGDAPNPTKL